MSLASHAAQALFFKIDLCNPIEPNATLDGKFAPSSSFVRLCSGLADKLYAILHAFNVIHSSMLAHNDVVIS